MLSLGAGFKKTLSMDATGVEADDVIAPGKDRLAKVDDDGVTFKSHVDGSMHRFTPEVSMQIQHQLGADIMFAFDELTTLMNTRGYQEESIVRTQAWAERCVVEHQRLTEERKGKPLQALFGVVQGAQHEDLRRTAARGLVSLGTGSTALASAVRSRRNVSARSSAGSTKSCPTTSLVTCSASASPTTCSPASRTAATPSTASPHHALLGQDGSTRRPGTSASRQQPTDATSARSTPSATATRARNYTRAYLHHLFKTREMIGATLATIHNERFIVRLVDQMRAAIDDGTFKDFKADFMARFYG